MTILAITQIKYQFPFGSQWASCKINGTLNDKILTITSVNGKILATALTVPILRIYECPYFGGQAWLSREHYKMVMSAGNAPQPKMRLYGAGVGDWAEGFEN